MTEPARVEPGPPGEEAVAAGQGLGPAAAGEPVEVRNRFDGRWGHGFSIDGVEEQHGELVVRVRRLSDGYVVPTWFPAGDVRTSPNA